MSERDGIKIPVAISGVTLLAVLFGSGIAYHKIDSQEEAIKELRAQLDKSNDTTVKERLAVVESDCKNLAHDMEQNASSHQAMWQAIGKKADR